MAQKKVKKRKTTKRDIAFILGVVAIALLVINALFSILTSEKIIESAQQDEKFNAFLQDYNLSGEEIQSAIIFFGAMWIIFAIVMILSLYNIKKKRWKYVLLAMGILTLITMRWISGILAIISAVLYIRKK